MRLCVEFVGVQIVTDAKVNENMSNFNLVEQRRGKRPPSGIGDDMRRTPMSMGMGYGAPPACLGPYSTALNVSVCCVLMARGVEMTLVVLRVSPI